MKVRRFPQQALLSHMLEQHLLADTHVRQITTEVASFHQTTPAATAGTQYGNPDHVAAPGHENFVQIREGAHDPDHLELLIR